MKIFIRIGSAGKWASVAAEDFSRSIHLDKLLHLLKNKKAYTSIKPCL